MDDNMDVVQEISDEEETQEIAEDWGDFDVEDGWGSGWAGPAKADDEPPVFAPELPVTRSYQQEMLDESLARNLIIAMDTGSGKTLIAILRMKAEAERESKKVNLAPYVSLLDC